MNQYNISAIRKLLKKSFSAEEFDDFCFDYFPSVQEEFTPGMTFSQQITLLLKFCRKSDCFDELLKFVKEKRYIRYRELIDVINTPTSVEMYLDDSDIDYPQSAPEYEKIFDQLFKLNQNIDAFRKENLETTTNKFSPTPLSQEFPQAEMENNELGKISLLHLKAAETAIRQMTQSTHEYNEKLAINNQRLTSYLAHPNKSRRKKGFYSFINGMIQAMNTFANQLESTIPTFSEQHGLAFDAYVREAAYSFSLALDDQIKLNVNLMLEISVVIYKPSLSRSNF